MRRKIIAVLLSVAMTLSLMPAMAFASDEYTITYEQSGTGDSYCLVWIGEARYPQTLNPGSTCSVSAGVEVQVSGNRNGNTLLEGWEVEPGGLVANTDNQRIAFTMPEEDVALTMNVSTLDPHASFDESGVLTWDAVEGYKSSVEIRPTDNPNSTALVNVTDLEAQGGKYTYDVRAALQDKTAAAGSYTATIFYYKGKDRYNDLRAVIENAATYNYTGDERLTLATPANLHWDGYVAKWDVVNNAATYEVTIGYSLYGYEQTFIQTVNTPQLNLRDLDSSNLHEGASYKFAVTALPENGSLQYAESAQSSYSDSIIYRASAAAPIISTQPQDASYTVGDSATALTVTASVADEGSLSYQWYCNTTNSNSGGTLINGETTNTYTPPVDSKGTTWYYCVVTNTLNGMTAQTTSDAARVEVSPAVVSYEVTVAGVEVTSENADDVLGDGKVAYYPEANLLRLTGATINGVDGTAIFADGDLWLQVEGDNFCEGRIKTNGDLRVDGLGSAVNMGSFDDYDATLTVRTTKDNYHCIDSAGYINIFGAALDLTTEGSFAQAMCCGANEDIFIATSYVHAKGPNTGISCDNGTINIAGSTVVAEGRYGISAGYQGSIEIRDSTATLNGTDSGGAYAQMMTVENSNVSVSTESYDYSMWILNTLTIKNSTFTSQSPAYGICAGNILVDDSAGETPTELTAKCDTRLSINIYQNEGQFKVIPKDGVLMDAFTYVSPGVDGPGIYRIDGAPFSTETVLADSYGGNYFQLKAHEHEAEAGWESNETSHWQLCVCDEKMNEADHTFAWVTDKEPTATEAGLKHEECTVCGFARAAVEIPATGTEEKPSDQTQPSENPDNPNQPGEGPDGQTVKSNTTIDDAKESGADLPQTGDDSDAVLWVAITMIVVGAFLAGAALYGRKKRSDR